ncbi:Proline-rich protein 4 [Hibiscus syriacus]|uniref:Proline-rich protein 4 n=1 Tax=Hibiscus syriacus TaxID=106335 RepID=A0A6A3BVR4_HIBSY|nr:Proline-rich protein 4 [Hibiscus syriacus]
MWETWVYWMLSVWCSVTETWFARGRQQHVGAATGSGSAFEVIGDGECADCAENSFETRQAFSGLRVTIDCKPEKGENFETRGSGELDDEGKFKVSLAGDMVKDGKLKEQCYAQLHSASAQPCPSLDGLESSKIIFKSAGDDGEHRFGLKGKLKFSPITCASASFWPHHHHKFSPLPKLPPLSPLKSFFHHHYPHPPIYKKPLPPPVPVYKPPVYKPHPVPVYKPPVYKPHPVPIYKPKPHPLPTIPKIHPIPKKPCPPIPKLHPKYFHHPKFGKWPPFAPHQP